MKFRKKMTEKRCNLKNKSKSISKTKKYFNKSFFIFIFFLLYLLTINQIFHKKDKTSDNKIINHLNKNNTFFNDRIFLCTVYNNEAEIVYIHLWRLYDYIDKFIIVVSNMTYSGLSKNITFKPFEENIKFYKDKIDIIYYDNTCNKEEFPSYDPIWCREASQRDIAIKYLEEHYNPTEKDLLIAVDMDEILTREGIEYIMKNPPKDFYYIKGSTYFPYYYHRLDDWDRGIVLRYKKNIRSFSKFRLMTITNENILRYKDNPSKPLITHCSYCFKNIEEYKNKLKSYAHQEHNTPEKTSNNWIFKSHYCREKIGSPVNENDEPYEGWKHLIPDDPRLKYLVDRSFMYPLDQTSYTEKDLETMCNIKYNRTPFEPSSKYIYNYI